MDKPWGWDTEVWILALVWLTSTDNFTSSGLYELACHSQACFETLHFSHQAGSALIPWPGVQYWGQCLSAAQLPTTSNPPMTLLPPPPHPIFNPPHLISHFCPLVSHTVSCTQYRTPRFPVMPPSQQPVPKLGFSFPYLILCAWMFCLHVCLYTTCMAGACENQRGHQIPCNWNFRQLWAGIQVLGIEPWCSGRATNAPNCWAASPVPSNKPF